MKIDGDDLVFKSGNRVTVGLGIVGLDSNLNLTEGYDLELWNWNDKSNFVVLTRDELLELSEHMISRWEEFRTKASRFVAR